VDPRLAFLEEDRSPDADAPRTPFDLVADALNEMGARIPEVFRTGVAPLPYSAAVNRYREWHAEQVAKALGEAGLPHDTSAVRSVLLWEDVTDNEHEGDLGNLPRLLSVLASADSGTTWFARPRPRRLRPSRDASRKPRRDPRKPTRRTPPSSRPSRRPTRSARSCRSSSRWG
jgi:hypothetical protein